METIPPMVRILPMDKRHEFNGSTIKNVQEQFFLKDLPFREGKYGYGKFLYRNSKMNAVHGSIVLFQYNSKIIALAELTYIQTFKEPQIGVDTHSGNIGSEEYKGAYYFDPYTIMTFNPMGSREIKSIWGEPFKDSKGKERKGFDGFGRSKYFLNPDKYPYFIEKIENIKTPLL